MSNLNKMQQIAVETTEGPLLILAGAGSGKTTVLVNRIAHMIENQYVHPYNILAITFTNKAAKEMKTRISAKLEGGDDIWASTFHSLCVRILRRDCDRLGFERSFVIYDTQDTKTLLKECIKELNIDDKIFTPNVLYGEISRAKDDMLEPKRFSDLYASDFRMSKIAAVYSLYQSKLKANNAMDFDDLICNTIRLFEENEDVLSYYQNRFKYIMVDEYQDTNNAQYRLIYLLAKKHRNLCVVGDDDQSIYKFRGANIRNILDFEDQFPDAKVIKLEQNYRSTKNILDAANAVIANNKKRKGKDLWTDGDTGDEINIYNGDDERDEAQFVAKEIDRMVSEQNYSFKDFAILYRTNAQSRVMEDTLLRYGLPYRVLAGLRFYDRKEIKDAIAYLRVVINPNDSVSLKRIINEPKRGIGDTSINKAETIAQREGKGMFDIISEAEKYADISRGAAKFSVFTDMIRSLQARKDELSVADFVETVLNESGYKAALIAENSIEARTRLENLDELLSAVQEFEKTEHEMPGLEGFLEEISLVSDIDNYDEDQPTVTLMTIHAAKGLEFPVVYIIGAEEGLFPSMRSMLEEEELEEERRLCYVAITRAKQKLYITCAASRMLFGQTKYSPASRFISEIPSELTQRFEGRKARERRQINASRNTDFIPDYSVDGFSSKPSSGYSSKPSAPAAPGFGGVSKAALFKSFDVRANDKAETDFAAGDVVEHKKFGRGTVLNVIPLGNDKKIEIAFDSGEKKNLMALFANLKKV